MLSHALRTVYLSQNQKLKPRKLEYLYGVAVWVGISAGSCKLFLFVPVESTRLIV